MAVYFIRHDGHIKIGKSVDPWKRLASLQTAHHDTLDVLDADNPERLQKYWKRSAKRKVGKNA